MPFTIPSFTDIRDTLLRDIANQLPSADTGPDSDLFIRAASVASAVEGLYQHQAWIVRQIFPDTADTEYLELHAAVRGLTRKRAVSASGLIRFTGIPGTMVPSGQSGTVNKQSYITTADSTLDATGKADIPAAAAVSGTAGNQPAGTIIQLSAIPAGIDSQATIIDMTGGTEQESDSELLARLLELIRRPPAGGNKYDYRRWAMNIPGVTAAYVYPLRRGLGTVDVVITAAGTLPSAETIAAVQAYINEVRPVTAKDCYVLAPTLLQVYIKTAILPHNITLDEAENKIKTALTAYFAQLIPGETVIKSRIEAIISDLIGIADRNLLSPAVNIIPRVNENVIEWATPGNVEVALL